MLKVDFSLAPLELSPSVEFLGVTVLLPGAIPATDDEMDLAEARVLLLLRGVSGRAAGATDRMDDDSVLGVGEMTPRASS